MLHFDGFTSHNDLFIILLKDVNLFQAVQSIISREPLVTSN